MGTYIAEAMIKAMQVVAQKAYYLHAELGPFAEEAQENLAINKTSRRLIQSFRRNSVIPAGYSFAEAQDASPTH